MENTDKLDIPSNLLQIVLEDDDFLKDTKFKILFTEPKVAINLVQTLIPFLETNKERNLDDVINNSITTYKFYDIELKNVPLCDRVSAVMEKSN